MSVADTTTAPAANPQTTFLPIKIVETFSNDTGSADMELTGIGEDSREYAIKQSIPALPYIPAVELFCYELCRLLRLPVPRYEIVSLPDGSTAFGSQWDGGAVQNRAQDCLQHWIMNEFDETYRLFEIIGRIYGLDLFINNIDRHWNNYLVVKNRNTFSTLAFDFGRALFNMPNKGFAGFDTFRVKEPLFANTGLWQLAFVQHNFHVHEEAERTLDEIAAIDKNQIEWILDKIPLEWLPQEIRQDYLDWWGTKEFNTRIDELKRRGLAQ